MLIELLDFISRNDKIGECYIATNGSIIPSDNLINFMKERDISVRISDYGLFSDKIKAMIDKCEKVGLKYRMYKFLSGQSMWYEKGGTDMTRTEDDEQTIARFKNCKNRNCWTLENGEFCYCTRADQAYIYQNFERLEDDYLKIEDSPNFHDKMYNYIKNPHAMEACRYCKGTTTENMVPPAIQM